MLLSVDDSEQRSPSGQVLIIEDDPVASRGLQRHLVADQHSVYQAYTCADARRLVREERPDVVIVDLTLPDGNGLDLVSDIREFDPDVGIVVLTGSTEGSDMNEALRRGATSYLRKPADPLTFEAQVRLALAHTRTGRRLARLATATTESSEPKGVTDLLERLPVALATQISHAWDLRHIETGAHVRRMGEFTRRLAEELGHSAIDAKRLGRVAMLHDVGKIAIPDSILSKPGRLTEEEFEIMKRHAEIGGKLLEGTGHPLLDLASRVARSHHERWDGSGYPDGLVQTECIREARIVALADVYDALSTARCYKQAWSRSEVARYFRDQRGVAFEADLVDALFDLMPDLELIRSEHPDVA